MINFIEMHWESQNKENRKDIKATYEYYGDHSKLYCSLYCRNIMQH